MKFLLLTSLMVTSSLFTFQPFQKQVSDSSSQIKIIPNPGKLSTSEQTVTASSFKAKIIPNQEKLSTSEQTVPASSFKSTTINNTKKPLTSPLQTLLKKIKSQSEGLPTILPEKNTADFFSLYRTKINQSSKKEFHLFLSNTISALNEEIIKDATSDPSILNIGQNTLEFFKELCATIPATDGPISTKEKLLITQILWLYECKIIPTII